MGMMDRGRIDVKSHRQTRGAAGGVNHWSQATYYSCKKQPTFTCVRSSHLMMCSAHRQIDIAVVSCAVQIASCVSGFAQSNNGYRATAALDRTSAGALREYVAHAVDAPPPAALPANLDAASTYRRLLETMLQRSPTFRRQCRRIANSPDLEVTLGTGGSPGTRGVRARTRIVRKDGRLLATIEVLRMDDPVELIAHEIEHVIEQLDGVDLPSKAAMTSSGVHLCAGEEAAFETDRATRVGLTVSAEVQRAGG
jgi:hypothetical protein